MQIDELEKKLEKRIMELGRQVDRQGEDEHELFNRQLEAIDILGMISPAKKDRLYEELGLDPTK